MKIRKNGEWIDFSLPVAIPTMTGASGSTNGSEGLVPAPTAGDKDKYLKADGTWEAITDTKVTNTLATTTKAYVTGTTSATTNTGTQVFDTGVYLDTTAGTLVAKTFKTSTGIEIY